MGKKSANWLMTMSLTEDRVSIQVVTEWRTSIQLVEKRGIPVYIPNLYRLNTEEAVKIMRTYPFAILVTVDEDRPIATHIPVEIREADGHIYVSGHVAFGNQQKNTLENNADVLLIFQGPHAYISSSWYEAENVPTWDYLAVHAYGKSRIISGDELETALAEMLQHYEVHRENGRLLETFTSGYIHQQMKGIVGFEVDITSIEASGKMSQNRNDRDYKAIVTELEKSNEDDELKVAQWMRERRNEVFHD
ncbi:FMN-binding negative transcriptional regulator [Alicyclobacillus tolerans]|uniref:FMN-binding negative transcriptional regulator n=1 Tax=Alicyclobacillus tolerans TaxID=90970 RepID=UPI001F48BF02|nr:FMN-binding negative transcriptional regulator [Alicyclobacillus tolerans]MCF8568036.1 FMN-binding negative transcriptional regulator [Alicyclobacillus tolerans]